MADIKDILSENRAFRIRLRKSLRAANQQRRGISTALATAIWVNEIKHRQGCRSAYELERLIEPQAFGRNEYGDVYHHNKWSKYEVGLHTPNKKLVQQVEALSGGTARLLYHPLWKLLSNKTWDIADFDMWIVQLSPEVRAVLQDRRNTSVFGEALSKKINGAQIKMLERRAGLDALAALTILIFNAAAQGDENSAFALGESLFRVLLIVCGFVPFCSFSSEIFFLFKARVFPLITRDGVGLDFEGLDFSEASSLLNRVMLILEDNELVNAVPPNATIRIKLQLLEGHYGFDVCFAMLPLLKPREPESENNKHLYDEYDRIRRRRDWGLSVLRENRHERFPPSWIE